MSTGTADGATEEAVEVTEQAATKALDLMESEVSECGCGESFRT